MHSMPCFGVTVADSRKSIVNALLDMLRRNPDLNRYPPSWSFP